MTVSKAIIVGAGPVGCYAAARLCQTRLVSEVHVYEKQEQVDLSRSVGRNVNITLCKRGNITLCKRGTVKSLYNALLYDWRESCLLIGPISLHKSLCLPGNWSKQVHKLILHENQLELHVVSRS